MVQNCVLSANQDTDALMTELDEQEARVARMVREIFPSNPYDKRVEYDVAARPQQYVESYLQLCLLFEQHGLRMFNVFPLSTSLVPRHVLIDTTILCKHLLGKSSNLDVGHRKFEYWSEVVRLNDKAFKPRSGRRFSGIIRTDGISCSVLLEPTSGSTKSYKRKRSSKRKQPESSEYFQDNLESLRNNLVFVDPNRRDLLYCRGIEENETTRNGQFKKNTLRYTQMQRRKETHAKIHRQKREEIETNHGLRGVATAETPSHKTLDLDDYIVYLR
ncbi:hypothetical protein HDV03_003069, partial [Kappamyces sp. JEL0829]